MNKIRNFEGCIISIVAFVTFIANQSIAIQKVSRVKESKTKILIAVTAKILIAVTATKR